MAKQTGIIPLQGTIGNVTFTKRGKSNKAQEKTSVPAGRFASNKNFDRVRENAAEFTSAANGGKVLRLAFRSQLKDFSGRGLATRMHSVMMQVVRGDKTHARGERNVVEGALELLEDFDFGKKILKVILDVNYVPSVDRLTGNLKVDIPSFIPREKLIPAPGTTHFKIFAAAADIDFATGKFLVDAKSTEGMVWDENPTDPISLTKVLTPSSLNPLFLVLGIQFYQEVNGALYSLKGNDFNAAAIVKTDMV